MTGSESMEIINMKYIKYEEKDQYGLITLSREKALNALNRELLAELDNVLDYVNLRTVRCLVITGQGKRAFAAGADIGEMKNFTRKEAKAFGMLGNKIFRKVETLPVPVIAAVNGYALGGGCELAMSCDVRLCSDNAVFGQPEVSLGITPGFGGTQRLARLVGISAAKQMIYTACSISADEAYRIGLVSAVYPGAKLLEQAVKMAEQIAANAPIAVRGCKKAINQGIEAGMEQAVSLEAEVFGDCFGSREQLEGMTAFLERRKSSGFLNM